jgi:hypothetical protein
MGAKAHTPARWIDREPYGVFPEAPSARPAPPGPTWRCRSPAGAGVRAFAITAKKINRQVPTERYIHINVIIFFTINLHNDIYSYITFKFIHKE